VIPTPTPTPISADAVTPGWVGFTITAVFILIAVALVFDMVRYREEARDRIAAELEAQLVDEPDGPADPVDGDDDPPAVK